MRVSVHSPHLTTLLPAAKHGSKDKSPAARYLRCDRPRMRRVLSNLIGNSIKFTSEGGAITVRAELADREVRFSVADTGSGIAADELPHIFERFWQARKTARLGAGLGQHVLLHSAIGESRGCPSSGGRRSTALTSAPSIKASEENHIQTRRMTIPPKAP